MSSIPAIYTRIATLQDLDSVATLFDAYRQFYNQEPDLPLATRFISDRMQKNESVIIVAEENDHRILGFCQLYPTYCSVEACSTYNLYDLFVSPHDRKGGTGRLLLMAAEELARMNGKARMDLTTAKMNLTAQSLYESLGWVRDEVFYAYSKHIVL
jgi:ribosomal protein S18 acetylase RimI-like enzyme